MPPTLCSNQHNAGLEGWKVGGNVATLSANPLTAVVLVMGIMDRSNTTVARRQAFGEN